jgi:predicted dehydrogenase
VISIGLGIIGCGKAAQALHLRALAQLADRFRIVSVCDASGAVALHVAERWAVAHWTERRVTRRRSTVGWVERSETRHGPCHRESL